MNIFYIILTLCSLTLFSAFVFSDLSLVRTVLIGALAVYMIGFAFELKSDVKTVQQDFRHKATDL